MSVIRYDKDSAGIVTLTLDAPGEPVNTMNRAFQQALGETVARLESEQPLAGVVFTSAKSTFFAGGDLRWLMSVQPEQAQAFFDEIEGMKRCFRRLEKLGRPVVAAINGSALGGGLELALACHHRVCVDDPRIQLGFPEATLGLLPGGGGVVKAVRLVGIAPAMPYIAEGKRMSPAEALRVGFVDELVSSKEQLLGAARAWIGGHPRARQPWDTDGHAVPGGTPSQPELDAMRAAIEARTHGNYPAPTAILDAAVEGARTDFDTAMTIESRHLTGLATGQVARNMIGTLFFQMNEARAGKSRPQVQPKWKASRVGVIGAGMMGSGIAWACASRDIECVLLDVSQERADKGRQFTLELLAKQLAKHRLDEKAAQRIAGRIRASASVNDLAGCDLVVEAVFEDRELKAQVTRQVNAVVAPTTVVASNTSTLPITGLASASSRPGNFIGLHFFSPVDKMQLVEIIRARQTSDETLARAYDFVLQIGKTPIVVNDARGFYTSRVFGAYVNEAMAMLGEGIAAAAIEQAAIDAGMPVGPLAVLDEVSLKLMDDVLHQELHDLAHAREDEGHAAPHAGGHGHAHGHDHDHDHDHAHAHGHDHAHDRDAHEHPDDGKHEHAGEHRHEPPRASDRGHGHTHDASHAPPNKAARGAAAAKSQAGHHHHHAVKSKRMPETAVYVLEKMAHGYKRMGRAYGAGFYDYPEGEDKHLWDGLKAFRRRGKDLPPEAIRDRLLYVQAIETVRCLQEGVVESTRDANIGSILGWGFPSYTGGTAQFVNHVGTRAFVERAQALATRYGERFAPPRMVVERAERGEPL